LRVMRDCSARAFSWLDARDGARAVHVGTDNIDKGQPYQIAPERLKIARAAIV